MKYRDGLGHVIDVPEYLVPAFERRRRPLLVAAIIVKCIILAVLLAIAWSH